MRQQNIRTHRRSHTIHNRKRQHLEKLQPLEAKRHRTRHLRNVPNMKQYQPGRLYQLDAKIYITIKTFPQRSSAHKKKCAYITIIEGANHPFTPEALPATVENITRDKIPIDKFINKQAIIKIQHIPNHIITKYQLEGIDYITINYEKAEQKTQPPQWTTLPTQPA